MSLMQWVPTLVISTLLLPASVQTELILSTHCSQLITFMLRDWVRLYAQSAHELRDWASWHTIPLRQEQRHQTVEAVEQVVDMRRIGNG